MFAPPVHPGRDAGNPPRAPQMEYKQPAPIITIMGLCFFYEGCLRAECCGPLPAVGLFQNADRIRQTPSSHLLPVIPPYATSPQKHPQHAPFPSFREGAGATEDGDAFCVSSVFSEGVNTWSGSRLHAASASLDTVLLVYKFHARRGVFFSPPGLQSSQG